MASFLFRLMTLALLLAGGMANAQLGGPSHIRPALVAETMTPRAGGTVTLAFDMRTERGWHGYWRNPGDAGVEPHVTWTLPPGVRAGPLLYPVPQTLIVSGLMNYVYESDHALLVGLTLPAGLARGTVLPIAAKLDYLVCSAMLCVPERALLTARLTIGDGAADAARAGAFGQWRRLLPRPLDRPARFARAVGAIRLEVPLPRGVALATPYFFPVTKSAIDYAVPQVVTRAGDALRITMRAANGAPPSTRLEGVLKLAPGQGIALTALPGPVAAGGDPVGGAAQASGGGAGGFLLALGGAMLGGLLLNLMPCVFPILSLKVLGLARAGGDERAARREALAYTAGAMLACLALGGVILILRAGGEAAGWAFQLQDPRVTLLLLVLVSAIGLNLAGLFELPMIGAGALEGGRTGAFLTGALAAFVATPCAGPFMAAALGAALLLPAGAALAVFGGLGLGLALPFLLLALVPRLRALLPRPGAWMETLRRLLALPMLATALWLAWVLGRQAGVSGMALGLAGALIAGVALWWVGLRQARGATLAWAPAALLLLAAPGLALVRPVSATAPATGSDEPYSAARLAALRAANRPVFVYLTADWCLTCKVNEAAAIDRAEVRAAFSRANVAVLVGDWTRGDPALTSFLAEQGRSGVPLYLFYPPGRDAQALPQLLTPGRLIALAS